MSSLSECAIFLTRHNIRTHWFIISLFQMAYRFLSYHNELPHTTLHSLYYPLIFECVVPDYLANWTSHFWIQAKRINTKIWKIAYYSSCYKMLHFCSNPKRLIGKFDSCEKKAENFCARVDTNFCRSHYIHIYLCVCTYLISSVFQVYFHHLFTYVLRWTKRLTVFISYLIVHPA